MILSSQAVYLLGSRVPSDPGDRSSDPLLFFFFFYNLSRLLCLRDFLASLSGSSMDDGMSDCIIRKAATWLERAHPDTDTLTDRRADWRTVMWRPLTLCAVLSGWVMSHCSLLSLMWWAVGRSDWPHSATSLLQSGSDLTPLPSHSYDISLLFIY